jgi:hypothetical protein
MAVTKKTVGAVLRSGLPATIYVEDFETKRSLDSIKTALLLLANILDGKTDDVAIDIAPDTEIEQGQGIKVQRRGKNRFKISMSDNESAAETTTARSGGGDVIEYLRDLLDVSVSTRLANQALTYNGSLWVNTFYPAFALMRHGFTISGNTLTLLSGKLKKHGAMVATTAQADFALGGTQYFYVHHVRSSTTSAWAIAGAEPGVSSTDIDIYFYKFNGATLVEVGAMGDINLDLPLA